MSPALFVDQHREACRERLRAVRLSVVGTSGFNVVHKAATLTPAQCASFDIWCRKGLPEADALKIVLGGRR